MKKTHDQGNNLLHRKPEERIIVQAKRRTQHIRTTAIEYGIVLKINIALWNKIRTTKEHQQTANTFETKP